MLAVVNNHFVFLQKENHDESYSIFDIHGGLIAFVTGPISTMSTACYTWKAYYSSKILWIV